MPERFGNLGAGFVGHVGKLPAVAVFVDLVDNRLLILLPGKSPEWHPFSDFIMDPRAMRTGDDLQREQRGF